MSEVFRKEGNEKYKDAMIYGITKSLKKYRLLDALKLYHKAYEAATNDDELASASKNLAVVASHLAPLETLLCGSEEIQHLYYKQAITNFCKAYEYGLATKPLQWLANVYDSLQKCFSSAWDGYKCFFFRKRIGLVEELIECVENDLLRAQYCLKIGRTLFNEAVANVNPERYKYALQLLRECHRPIEEARRLMKSIDVCDVTTDMDNDIDDLDEDCHLHFYIAESIQARLIGDDLLHKVLMNEEHVDTDMLWDIIDWYKKAIIQTREKDVEQEAIALSRLGFVYGNVLKNSHKATESYHQCVQIALSMKPRNFDKEDWYIEATQMLRKFQDEIAVKEELEWQEKRSKYLKDVEEEMIELEKEFKKSGMDYIRYIYNRFPPKRADQKLVTENKTLKAIYKSALIHYHPDKQKQYGDKWTVMCEEICKLLTQRYDAYKYEAATEKKKADKTQDETQQKSRRCVIS